MAVEYLLLLQDVSFLVSAGSFLLVDELYVHLLDGRVLLDELNDLAELERDLLRELVLVSSQEGLEILKPFVELHGLLDVLHPLLELVAIIAGQI